MRKYIPLILAFTAIFIALLSLLISYNAKSKIAYVNSSEVVDKFIGIRQAQSIIEQNMVSRNIKYDSLVTLYDKAANDIKLNRTKLKKEELTSREVYLSNMEAEITRYQRYMAETEQEEEQKLLQGSLNQINSFIKQYAEKNNIDLVIGVTLSGNVLYGSDQIDITATVIEGLNKTYSY